MALSWTLRDPRVTSALVGASSVAQLEENLAAAGKTAFSAEEIAAIDKNAVEAGINIWSASSSRLTDSCAGRRLAAARCAVAGARRTRHAASCCYLGFGAGAESLTAHRPAKFQHRG